MFHIDVSSGQISVNKVGLDYESCVSSPCYTLSVKVVDNGSPENNPESTGFFDQMKKFFDK